MSRKEMTEQEKIKRQEFLKNESKDDKFKRIAEPRLKKAIRTLNQVTKMANSSIYSVSDEDAEKIEDALQESLDALHNALTGAKQSKEIKDIFD